MTGKLSRREFVRQLGIGTLSVPMLLNLLAGSLEAQGSHQRQSIIWLQGQSSRMHNSGTWSYPGYHEFIRNYFTVISAETPDVETIAIEYTDRGKPHILILDGYFSQDHYDPLNNLLKDLIVVSKAVILLGNEAAYSSGRPDGFLNLETELLHLVETPFIKLPGNPVHTRHLVGTLNHLIMYDVPELDEYRRPLLFYSQYICDHCQYRGDFEKGNFVDYFGQREGCLYLLGCKGPVTKNTCAVEKWNDTSTWCVAAGSPCTGCSEPDYPDNQGLGMYGQLTSDEAPINSFFVRNAATLAQGAFAVTVAGVGIHAVTKRISTPLKTQEIIDWKGKGNE